MHLDSRRPQQVLTFNGKYDTMNSEAELFSDRQPVALRILLGSPMVFWPQDLSYLGIACRHQRNPNSDSCPLPHTQNNAQRLPA